ncbi:MAG TPA: sulfatase-like hydrolase/transferase, partial [Bacteroidia bacterium]|nr:sulfatase-like hydrolase/transferase [Bacteroidia bacterium]
LRIFFHALGLDFSAAAYLTSFPVLILIVHQYWHASFLNKLTQIYFIAVIVLSVLISVANTVLYKFWLQLLGYRAIQFLADPNEILASVNGMQAIMFIAFFVISVSAIVALYFKINEPLQVLPNILLRMALLPALGFITFYFIRGGLQVIPINESAAYFSNNTVSNHAAVNPQWYFIRNMQLAGRAGSNPLAFNPASENEKQFNAMMHIAADTQQLISGNANLLFIILESHTADVVAALGGDSGNSPCMDAIIKNDALTFTQCYASGFRTDQMLPSLFSGFPAQNNNSIIRHSDKVHALPHLPKMFAAHNYHNAFYYAGEMNFANMKSYLVQSGFKALIDKNNFKPQQLNSKWGAHDGFAFDKLLTDLDKQQQPFFTS